MAWHVEGADAGGGGYAGLAVEGVGSGSGLGERSPGPGLRVLEVDPQGPAFEGGVVKGDILVKWDEQWLFTPVHLCHAGFRAASRPFGVGGGGCGG
ncbi:MAG: hypothetical protein ACO34E_07990 [Limisphaerales bacterium]